ncbi:MAG: hypothetical protein AAF385_01895 [Pseudomonadota bacterium]
MTGKNKFSKSTENLSTGRRAQIEKRKIELFEEVVLYDLSKTSGRRKPDRSNK